MRSSLLVALLLMVTAPAFAADKAAGAPRWSSQAACAMATKTECAQDKDKAWRASAKKTAAEAAVPPAASEPPAPPQPAAAEAPAPEEATTEAAKSETGFFSKLFGDKTKPATKQPLPPLPKAVTEEPPAALVLSKPPEMQRQPVDPEVSLRGKVWTSEVACKKEALKGKCSSIDCATHSGGACTGYTSMIWIYR